MDDSTTFEEKINSIISHENYLNNDNLLFTEEYDFSYLLFNKKSDLSYGIIENLYIDSENKTEFIEKKTSKRRIKNNSKEIHSKNSKDNIINKIAINYIKFLINLANEYIRKLKIKERFFDISGKFNSKKSLEHLNWLMNLTLKQILELECSGKCNNQNNNKKLMSTIDYEEHKKFFDLKFEEIYNQFYYKNNRKKFEEMFTIKLSSKIKMNKSFLNYIKKKYPLDTKYHKQVMENSKNFINYIKSTPWKKKSKNKNNDESIIE